MDGRNRYTDDPTLRRMQTDSFAGSRSRADRHQFWDTVLDRDSPGYPHQQSNIHPSSQSSTSSSKIVPGGSPYPRMDSASLRHNSSHSFHHGPFTNTGPSELDMMSIVQNNSSGGKVPVGSGRRKEFQCDICKVAFSQKSHLTQHVKTVHEKIRPYKCDQCTRAFGKRYDLISHIDAVHKKERPHGCPYCNKQFAKRSNLTRHIEHMHPSKRARE